MRFSQTVFLATMLIAALIVIAGGQHLVGQHFSGEQSSLSSGRTNAPNRGVLPPFATNEFAFEGRAFAEEPAHCLNRHCRDDGFVSTAHAVDESHHSRTIAYQIAAHEQGEDGHGDLPQGPELHRLPTSEQIPALDKAGPSAADNAEQDALARTIIDEELPNASDEERDVWRDELKGMPPQMMRDLLRLRQQFGSKSPLRTAKLPKLLPSIPIDKPIDPRDLLPPDPRPHDFVADDDVEVVLEPAIRAIRMARDVILNNLANANTIGFKRSQLLFEDMPYRHYVNSGQQDMQGRGAPVGLAVGLGMQFSATQTDHAQGTLRKTGKQLDLAITGDGFFQIQDGAQILYTRSGRFALNADGELTLVSAGRGRILEPALTVPQDTIAIQISTEGIVSVEQAGSSSLSKVGHIQLARFVNPAGLKQVGENLFAQREASGPPSIGIPGQEGRGTVRQGFLEHSNVNLQDELSELKRLQTQLNAIQAALVITGEPTSMNRQHVAGERPLSRQTTVPRGAAAMTR